jgi:cellulose synthase/poly-beta-1,6-N-acetylglucosamine synthase-like glycosyltransferase
MKTLVDLSSLGLALSVLGIGLVVLINPLLTWAASLFKRSGAAAPAAGAPSVSLIVAVRNAETLVADKIRNALSIECPFPYYEILVVSDGSTDRTEARVQPFLDGRVRLLACPRHEGKARALNRAAASSSGEILVFSDVDGMLASDSMVRLVKAFAAPDVGGVCGQRLIGEDRASLKAAQGLYIRLDSALKRMESRLGTLTSNDGKLYAVRRQLFRDIPDAVTDDLYVCLTVVAQGFRFLFEPEAKVCIRLPSRSPRHEVERRRRIVSTSLRAIWLMKRLLNPLAHGSFALRLLVNKVLRRLMPVFLLGMLVCSALLSSHAALARGLLAVQIGFYLFALSYGVVWQHAPRLPVLTGLASVAYYSCAGNYGALLGLVDFLAGRRIIRWEPVKEDTR